MHDSLIEYGGGEKVLETLLEIFPEADVYTSVIDTDFIFSRSKLISQSTLISSWLQPLLPFLRKNRRVIQLAAPFFWPFFNLQKYDLVIAHGWFYFSELVFLGKSKPGNTQNRIWYSIGPAKNIWGIEKKHFVDRLLFQTYYPILRFLQKKSIAQIDTVLVVSKAMNELIKQTGIINAKVVYPPCSVDFSQPTQRKYFLYVGRLSKEKNIELLVKTFVGMQARLLVIGEGPEFKRLSPVVTKNIEFLGYQESSSIQKYLKQAIATIHISEHDAFPLSPVESLAAGVPVVAYRSGGVTESITEGRTGVFFDKKDVRALKKAISKVQKLHTPISAYHDQARNFSKKVFVTAIKTTISEI